MQNPVLSSRPGPLELAALLSLSLMWGSSFMFVKLAVLAFAPFTLAACRILIAALFLTVVTWISGHRLPRGWRVWRLFVLAGIVGLLVPFSGFAWGQQVIDSSVAAVVMGSIPLTTLFLAHMFTPDEKLTSRRLAGVAIGLAGLTLLFEGTIASDPWTNLPRLLAMFLGSLGYATSGIILRRTSHIPPQAGAAAVMIAAAVPTSLLALLVDGLPPPNLGLLPVLSAVYLGLFSSAIGTAVMMWLIFRAGATFMSLNNYLVPVVGVLWGTTLLSEPISGGMVGGLLLILTGVAVAGFAKPPLEA